MHKGKIEVESVNNKTRFTIYLPIGKSYLKAEDIITETENVESVDFDLLSLGSELSPETEPQEIESFFNSYAKTASV